VKVAEAHALAAQLVQVGRFQRRIPMRRKIAVALIVADNDDDVGAHGLRLSKRHTQDTQATQIQQELAQCSVHIYPRFKLLRDNSYFFREVFQSCGDSLWKADDIQVRG